MGCRGTKRFLDEHGIEYQFRDVDSDPEAMAHVQGLGVLQVPVVDTGETYWYGYRPDMLRTLVDPVAA